MHQLAKTVAIGSLVSLLTMGSCVMAQPQGGDPAQPTDAATQPASPGKINLDLDGAGAEEAFDQLAKQAGVELFTQDAQTWFNADPVVIKVQDGSFWPTFLDLCKQARLDFDANNGFGRAGAIRIYFSGNDTSRYSKCPSVISEGFVIMATNANRNYTIDYANPPANGDRPASFSIQLLVFIDPARQVLHLAQPAITEAVDENGVSLMLPNNNSGGYDANEMGSLVRNSGIQLTYPANAGRKIARIKGSLRAMAASKYETITIDNLLTTQATKKSFPDYDVIIDQPTKPGGNQYQMKITFRMKDRGGVPGLHQRQNYQNLWPLVGTMVITDAEGHRYSNNGGGGGGGDQVLTYNLSFSSFGGPDSGIGEPAKLTWRIPTQTREIRIPFEFKDLPIP